MLQQSSEVTLADGFEERQRASPSLTRFSKRTFPLNGKLAGARIDAARAAHKQRNLNEAYQHRSCQVEGPRDDAA